ncbi:probable inactive poly [ADP-ribose] polymerase SRO5 [Andrographis paniculata]|uniref:probable inactive poly [ADP-ribose] polymerase SRO5 n=1 Tax=Andrographis paniculata TaxID=175694 RepID=UPI0021E972E7|nr:probable inactive poly [ADP-ribose] polymerase SRO5 [Andrographis paniculata]XP_051116722.1 probable inactive poly [ADP-ribose] polymerase SRO5 [Andrographis paniculata]XP_051116723.1 probable inactive poly [ADP-ribose] polymerase SRO5 [Andrographis paniculata]
MCTNKQGCKVFSPSMDQTNQSSKYEDLNLWDSGEDQAVRDSCPSDCESGISGPENDRQSRISDSSLIRICEGDTVYETIEEKLGSGLSSCGVKDVRVESVHRVDYSAIINRAKLHCFCIYSRALKMSRGDANVKFAWYGGSKNEICRILAHGFGLPDNAQTQDRGVCLSPVDCPVESFHLSAGDDDSGVSHMLLCRVIMGKMEAVCVSSGQCCPSSGEFDSGVDDLVSPRKYIVWCTNMNTHILPEFLVSFQASYFLTDPRGPQPRRSPKSDWMPFTALITELSKYLPLDAVRMIAKHHYDYKKRKITRHDMIQKVRRLAGDELLMEAIKLYGGKIKASRSNA